jgi:hypothetical protein
MTPTKLWRKFGDLAHVPHSHEIRITRRTRAAAAAALVTATLAAPSALAAGNDHGGIVPRRDGSKAVPFVPVLDPAPPTPQADGFAWGDAGIGAGAGVAAVLLASAGGRVIRSRKTGRQSPLSASRSAH